MYQSGIFLIPFFFYIKIISKSFSSYFLSSSAQKPLGGTRQGSCLCGKEVGVDHGDTAGVESVSSGGSPALLSEPEAGSHIGGGVRRAVWCAVLDPRGEVGPGWCGVWQY